MGLFLEILEYQETSADEITHRIPERGSADIKMGAQLIVRTNQAAIFSYKGQAADVFPPGKHTITTANLPVITRLLSLPWGFKSPFRAEVYFVNMKTFTDLRWGTKEPVAFRDKELGIVRLRGFGRYTLRVTEPLLFINSIVGQDDSFNTSEIEDYLRDVIVARLYDHLAKNLTSILDLPARYTELADAMEGILASEFTKYGIELVDFYITAITPPEEVQKAMDERAKIDLLGAMDRYQQYKAAQAMEKAASNPGGGGFMNAAVMGVMLPGMMASAWRPDAPASPVAGTAGAAATAATAAAVTAAGAPGAAKDAALFCPACHAAVTADSRFCGRCGHALVMVARCLDCGAEMGAGARFCPACGKPVRHRAECAKCRAALPPGTKFCSACGEGQPT